MQFIISCSVLGTHTGTPLPQASVTLLNHRGRFHNPFTSVFSMTKARIWCHQSRLSPWDETWFTLNYIRINFFISWKLSWVGSCPVYSALVWPLLCLLQHSLWDFCCPFLLKLYVSFPSSPLLFIVMTRIRVITTSHTTESISGRLQISSANERPMGAVLTQTIAGSKK